ncbi:hypothetical protein RJ639_012240 [Escallonia herrerae]|uniref:UBN2 domain-containing protein n=1 Tax=Escallonia herrerae TaxID=1293975 RepID=A0AA88VN33_9ASTE|nr:hypothetical protein RJ639_012240 [Escallonia herrerae]
MANQCTLQDTVTLKELKQKDARTLFIIQQALTEQIFPRIIGANTAKVAWNTLQEEFQGSIKVCIVRLQTLRRDIENIKMKDSETIQVYYDKLKETVNQMRAYGENISDKKVVEKLLISLTEKYDSIVAAIEESKNLETLSVVELIGSQEAHEKRLSRQTKDSVESAFQSKLNLRSQKFENNGEMKLRQNYEE